MTRIRSLGGGVQLLALVSSLAVGGCGGDGGGLGPGPEAKTELHHVRGVVRSALSGQPVVGAGVGVDEVVGVNQPAKRISSSVTGSDGEFAVPFWTEPGATCYVGGWLWADHQRYAPYSGTNLCPLPEADVTIKLQPYVETAHLLPATAAVPSGGSQEFVSDVTYYDGTRTEAAGSWRLVGGAGCGTISTEFGARATYTAPLSLPAGGCGDGGSTVLIQYTIGVYLYFTSASAIVTLQP